LWFLQTYELKKFPVSIVIKPFADTPYSRTDSLREVSPHPWRTGAYGPGGDHLLFFIDFNRSPAKRVLFIYEKNDEESYRN
jgi:hypothetical protein